MREIYIQFIRINTLIGEEEKEEKRATRAHSRSLGNVAGARRRVVRERTGIGGVHTLCEPKISNYRAVTSSKRCWVLLTEPLIRLAGQRWGCPHAGTSNKKEQRAIGAPRDVLAARGDRNLRAWLVTTWRLAECFKGLGPSRHLGNILEYMNS